MNRPVRATCVAILLLGSGCAALVPTLPPPRQSFDRAAPHPSLGGLRDVRGAIELHSRHSHDGTTPIAQIARIAEAAGLDFIIITDHNTLAGKPKERLHGRPLVLVGTELSTEAGHLLALGITEEIPTDQPIEQIIDQIHGQRGLAMAAHPTSRKKPWTRWDVPLDGLEIFNVNAALLEGGKAWVMLKGVLLPNPLFWQTTVRRPDAALGLWDRYLSVHRPLVGIAGHDTHAHAGIRPFIVDSYQSGFRLVATHALVTDLTPDEVYGALRSGRCYVAFDGAADPRPFVFGIQQQDHWVTMGQHVPWRAGTTALVSLASPAAITLFRDGEPVGTVEGSAAQWPVESPGVYRIEVTRHRKPWIFSNPIYVQENRSKE